MIKNRGIPQSTDSIEAELAQQLSNQSGAQEQLDILTQELEDKNQAQPAVDELVQQLNRPMRGVVTPQKDTSLEELNKLAEIETSNKYKVSPEGGYDLISPEDIEAERARQNVAMPTSLDEMQGSILGSDEDLSEFTVGMNQLGQERTEQLQEGNLVKRSEQMRNNIKFAQDQTYSKDFQPYSSTSFYDIRSRANSLREKFKTDNVSIYQGDDSTSLTPEDAVRKRYKGYIDNSPNQDAAINNIAVAYELATFKVLGDLAKFGLGGQDVRAIEGTESPDAGELDIMGALMAGDMSAIEENKTVDIGELIDNDIYGIKADITSGLEADPTSVSRYRHMHSIARGIDSQAQKYLTKQGVDPDRSDSPADMALAEYVLQNAIDYNADTGKPYAQLRGYVDRKDGNEYYFASLTRDGMKYANTINDMTFLLMPQEDMPNLGQTTPPSIQGELGANALNERKKALSNPGREPIPDDQAKNLLEGVGRVVEPRLFAIIKELFDLGSATRAGAREQVSAVNNLAAAYFKLEEKNLAATKDRVYRKKKAELTTAVKNGYTNLTPEQIEDEALAIALDAVTQAQLTGWQLQANNIGLAMKRMNDVDTNNRQKTKYARWLISAINHRMQEISSDMQSQDKAITRTLDNFADKAYITIDTSLSPEQEKAKDLKLANKLNNILNTQKGGSRIGMESIDRLNEISSAEEEEMGAKIMFATLYLKLASEGLVPRIEHTFFNGRTTDQRLKTKDMGKRMEDPAQLLKYYADHSKEIMSALQPIAMEAAKLGTTPGAVTSMLESQYAPLLERGELGYYVSVLEDVANYNAAKSGNGGRLQLKGFTELDSSNSNIIIQTLLSGNPKLNDAPNAAATLGVYIGLGDAEVQETWRNTLENPTSFYDILSNNYSSLVDNLIGDPDKQDALNNFFQKIISRGHGKDVTRSIVIGGFYGLHPSLNDEAVIEFLHASRDAGEASYADILIENGPYKDLTEAIEDLKLIQGANFQRVFGNLSLSYISKRLGAFLTLNDQYAPIVKSPTGAISQAERNELQPEFGDFMDMHDPYDSGAYGKRTIVTTKGRDGREQAHFVNKKAFNDGKVNYSVNSNGELENTSKLPGFKYADGYAAVLTQMYDALVLKLTILAANKDKAVPVPIVTVHDAIKVNAKSYIRAWTAYNRVALPGLVNHKTFLETQHEMAVNVLDTLTKDAQKVAQKTNGKGKVFIGTSPASKFRSLPYLLDYVYKNNNEPKPSDSNYRFRMEKYQRTTALLDKAASLGWIPNDISHSKTISMLSGGKDITEARASAVIDAAEFYQLVQILADLYEVKRLPDQLLKAYGIAKFTKHNTPDTMAEERINSDIKNKKLLKETMNKGNWKVNNLNEF